MADKEMYDYLDTVTPDYTTTTFSVTPQQVIQEDGHFNQSIHMGADGSEEVVTYSAKKIFYVTLVFPVKTSSDIGTIFDFYFDTAKAYGISRSFKWAHPTDTHTYVVKFRDAMSRSDRYFYQGISNVRLKVIGRIADA
jgi:hypothetical protein